MITALCMRPRLEPVQLAGNDVRHCISCGWWSPPFDQQQWEDAHRSEAVAANCEIGDKGRAA